MALSRAQSKRSDLAKPLNYKEDSRSRAGFRRVLQRKEPSCWILGDRQVIAEADRNGDSPSNRRYGWVETGQWLMVDEYASYKALFREGTT